MRLIDAVNCENTVHLRSQGKWIMESKLYGGFGDRVLVITCSRCIESFIYRDELYNFCPNCGSDMVKGENND